MKKLILFVLFLTTYVRGGCIDYGSKLICSNDMDLERIYLNVKHLVLMDLIPRLNHVDIFLPNLENIEVQGSTKSFCDLINQVDCNIIGCEG